MFHANSVAMRSADLGRQVGAAITTAGGEIIAMGCNDVPRAGGGLYWSDDEPDMRDFQLGFDSAAKFRNKIVAELATKLLKENWTPPAECPTEPRALAEWMAANQIFKGTRLQNLLEYGRAVHAEMAALSDASRRGSTSISGPIGCVPALTFLAQTIAVTWRRMPMSKRRTTRLTLDVAGPRGFDYFTLTRIGRGRNRAIRPAGRSP